MSCSALIDSEIRQRLREQFDFSPARFDLLAQLAQSKSGLALSDVSKLMKVSQSNVTALTSQLIRSGHIRRTTSPTDRRVQIISLTSAGRAAFRKMDSQRTKWVAELFAKSRSIAAPRWRRTWRGSSSGLRAASHRTICAPA